MMRPLQFAGSKRGQRGMLRPLRCARSKTISLLALGLIGLCAAPEISNVAWAQAKPAPESSEKSAEIMFLGQIKTTQ